MRYLMILEKYFLDLCVRRLFFLGELNYPVLMEALVCLSVYFLKND